MQAPIPFEMPLDEEWMVSSPSTSENRFLTASPTRLFVANAAPMMVLMMMSGLQSIVDAAFLGHFVGADALAAVSIVFPVLMVTIALSTLVGGGMSSLLARHLGANERRDAEAVFARAHGLALFLALVLIAAFLAGGGLVTRALSAGRPDIARMAWTYLAVMIFASPVQLLLSVHADAWRNEGRAGLMALMSVGVTLGNVALNYLLIVRLDMGVAGSAWGTALAQGVGLVVLVAWRLRGGGVVPLRALGRSRWTGGWRGMMALGAPVSLSFVGIALVSATVITTLRLTAGPGYADTVAAYGIVTRIFSFTFLPMMAIALASQSIVGNNVGAKLYRRSDAVLRIALGAAFVYCAAVEVTLLSGHRAIGRGFVGDPAVVAQVGEILRPMAAFYLFAGPVLVLALYFQAIGQPLRTAMLTLSKPFALSPLLIVAIGALAGARAIWLAFPLADGAVAVIAVAVALAGRASGDAAGFGLANGGEVR